MNYSLSIRLETTEGQQQKLRELQHVFADACNALAPLVQRTGCWNRVALHHLAYRSMREQFPALGSQMVCNALYSVSRAARLVYQHPRSPFNVNRLAGRALPTLRFLPQSPVYFDRHTLSLKGSQASLYTLDGRMRFHLPLAPEDALRFRRAKLREIVLLSDGDRYVLRFGFDEPGAAAAPPAEDLPGSEDLPEYLLIEETPVPSILPHAVAATRGIAA